MSDVPAALDLLRRRLDAPPVQPASGIPELAERIGAPLRVAVARFDGIGDWVLTLPIVAALEASEHVGAVTLVGPAGHAGLLGRGADYLPYRGPTIVAPPWPGGTLGKVRAATRPGQQHARRLGELERGRFDLVIAPRWDSDFGFNVRHWAVGAGALLAGHDPAAVPGALPKERAEAGALTIRAVDERPAAHEIEHLVVLERALGIAAEPRPGYGRDFFHPGPPPVDGSYVVLHTSSVEPKRQWPADRWRAVAEGILAGTDGAVVVVGAPSEREEHERMLDGLGPRARSLAGQLPMSELPALMAGADAFVGNDSGPMHVAASMGTPVVVVSPHPVGGDPAHRNSPERFGPWGTDAVVLRPPRALAPCTDSCTGREAHCITLIEPAAVLEAFGRVVRSKR